MSERRAGQAVARHPEELRQYVVADGFVRARPHPANRAAAAGRLRRDDGLWAGADDGVAADALVIVCARSRRQ